VITMEPTARKLKSADDIPQALRELLESFEPILRRYAPAIKALEKY